MTTTTLKKHFRQMNPSDFRYIRAKVRNLNHMMNMGLNLRMTQHTYNKIDYGNARNVNRRIIKRLLKDYEVIEYKLILKDGCSSSFTKDDIIDERVVLRSNFVINGSDNVVITFSLKNNIVITSWNNNVKDRHYNVDLSKYTLDTVGLHCLV